MTTKYDYIGGLIADQIRVVNYEDPHDVALAMRFCAYERPCTDDHRYYPNCDAGWIELSKQHSAAEIRQSLKDDDAPTFKCALIKFDKSDGKFHDALIDEFPSYVIYCFVKTLFETKRRQEFLFENIKKDFLVERFDDYIQDNYFLFGRGGLTEEEYNTLDAERVFYADWTELARSLQVKG